MKNALKSKTITMVGKCIRINTSMEGDHLRSLDQLMAIEDHPALWHLYNNVGRDGDG